MEQIFPDLYYDTRNNNPCIDCPNAMNAIFFYQSRDTLFRDAEMYKKFIDNAVARFRKSRTYTNYKSYLMELGLTNCQILGNISSEMATIEMHHNGITIFDIALMITSDRLARTNRVSTFDIVVELKKVHRNNQVPLVMLCKTMHQLNHAEETFTLPASMTFGNWVQLIEDYKLGITYGIAKKLKFWIKNSIEHTNDDQLNKELIGLYDTVQKWSDYNEYCIANNVYDAV